MWLIKNVEDSSARRGVKSYVEAVSERLLVHTPVARRSSMALLLLSSSRSMMMTAWSARPQELTTEVQIASLQNANAEHLFPGGRQGKRKQSC